MIDIAAQALISQLPALVDPIDVEVKELAKPTFFVHFDKATLQVRSVSTREEPEDGNAVASIEYDHGLALMTGEQSIVTHEIIMLRNETYEFVKKETMQKVMDRVDVVRTIYEIEDDKDPQFIEMLVLPEEDIVEISYNGDLVQKGQTKFYFTRFNDPSFLKCAFLLDVNTLNQIALVNQTEWPNPIRLKIDNVSDLSVFGIKGQTKATIRNVKASP